MPDREKVTYGLRCMCYVDVECKECPYARNGSGWHDCRSNCAKDALALLKEREEQKQKLLQNIADNQLANCPDEWQSPEQKMYSKGLYDGLQIAYEMIAYGVKKE